ncbi:hypothetical protein Pcinc_032219 [Petrolisthes cinctipes]|uniref:Uncharacterized protein n=1 Tax=Petrolisthes cinctipes TaxID=88211 RepID=A0AAE1EUK1_PETCI|nr:hypothetical protein Pcinc_032219 [Petrolisthes cinctipes]
MNGIKLFLAGKPLRRNCVHVESVREKNTVQGVDGMVQFERQNLGFSVVESDDVTILRVSEGCERLCVGGVSGGAGRLRGYKGDEEPGTNMSAVRATRHYNQGALSHWWARRPSTTLTKCTSRARNRFTGIHHHH